MGWVGCMGLSEQEMGSRDAAQDLVIGTPGTQIQIASDSNDPQ